MSGSSMPVLVGDVDVAVHESPVAVHEAQVTRALGGGPRRRRSDPRWEVTDADLNMYALIVGRTPSEGERLAALTGASPEAEALSDARGGGDADDEAIEPAGSRGRSWSPAVLCHYLREFCSGNLSLRVTGPQVSAWVRQVSTEARRRLQQTQSRLARSR